MLKELIVLADELDKCNEKQAADFVDKLIKRAMGEEEDPPLTPLTPQGQDEPFIEDDFPEEPTKVEFVSKTGKELVSRLRHFFTKFPDPMKWSEEDRAKVLEAMEVLKG